MNWILNKQKLKPDRVWQNLFQKYSAATKCTPTKQKRAKIGSGMVSPGLLLYESNTNFKKLG